MFCCIDTASTVCVNFLKRCTTVVHSIIKIDRHIVVSKREKKALVVSVKEIFYFLEVRIGTMYVPYPHMVLVALGLVPL